MLRLRHGVPLFHEGTPLAGFYVVCGGLVAQCSTRETVQAFCMHGKGDCPNLVDGLLGLPSHRTTAFAIGEALVACIPCADLRAAIETLPRSIISLLLQTARQTGHLEDRLLRTRVEQSYDRVLDLFGQLLSASGQAIDAEVVLDLPVDRPLFAKLTGMAPETFSRMMTLLRSEGLVVPSDKGICLPHPSRLLRPSTALREDCIKP